MIRLFGLITFLLFVHLAQAQFCGPPISADNAINCGTVFCEGDTICVQNNTVFDPTISYFQWIVEAPSGQQVFVDSVFGISDTFFVISPAEFPMDNGGCFDITLNAIRICDNGIPDTGNNNTKVYISSPPEANIEVN
ncbi:MAG: hypothetical protein AAFV80_16085, partial [Bacteroidota bacterium]